MRRPYLSLVFALALIALPLNVLTDLFCQQAGAQILLPHQSVQEQILVLKNGSFVAGLIEQRADHFSVQTRQGSRLVIDNEKADFVCSSLQEAYWGKLARTGATDTDGQTQLLHWCMQHHLLTEAGNQIEVLQATGFSKDRLAYCRRQLELAILQIEKPDPPSAAFHFSELSTEMKLKSESQLARPDSFNQPASYGTVSKADGPAFYGVDFFADLDPIFTPLPDLTSQLARAETPPQIREFKTIGLPGGPQPSEIAQVTYAEPIADAMDESAINGSIGSSIEIGLKQAFQSYQIPAVHELDSFTRELPAGALGRFRQQFEPVLIRQCSDCHSLISGEADGALPLVHAGKTQPLSRRMTQRNMHAAYHYVNREQPLSSRLLTAATTKHGGSDGIEIPLESEDYQRLHNWLISLSENESSVDRLIEPARFSPVQLENEFGEPNKAKPIKVKAENPSRGFGLDTGFPPTIGEIPKLNSKPARFQPRDEFDPEIFNRMNGG